MRLYYVWPLISFLSLLPESVFASVLAIDYGADWIKASLIKPGLPFDVLLNKDSKRKIQSCVGWKNDDRMFGTDAFNLASRFPSDSFPSVKYLLAAPVDSDSVAFFANISTAEVVETPRKTIALRRSDGSEWSSEELVGMQFSYVKGLAEALAGEKVNDVVVTVPSFYSQFERDAVADAIEVAGLRTLALISDGTAVAINYAMTRSFPTPEYHIIYDAGASAIRATVVLFSTDRNAKGELTETMISIAGVGYDRTTGGNELDRRLREILVESFSAKYKKDIRGNKKAMAKLWKEAGRVKAILSANSDAMATVESLAFDIDFRSKVTRSSFENACADLKDRFSRPIFDALNNVGLNLDNISSVILTGGSTRTPMIQGAVRDAVGEEKIALNVNADEAAVLGAAFHGATLSRQFRTKSIKVSDIVVHDIQASYLSAPSSVSGDSVRTINTAIFPAGSKVGNKKILTFKRKEDFSVWLDYKNPVAEGLPSRILEVDITGVGEALGNLTERGAADPVVRATVRLSESGFVSVPDAVAFGEIKDDSLTGKLKEFFGGGNSPPVDDSQAPESIPVREPEGEPSSSASLASSSPAAETTTLPKEVLKDLSTIPLNVTVKFASMSPMTANEKRTARSRLRAMDQEEAGKQRREETRNNFESYLYRIRDLLDDESKDTPFKKCSQESERKAIGEKLEESFAWIHDKGDSADTVQFLDKRSALEVLERPIIHRYQEVEAFPQTLNNSQMWNWSTRLFLQEARANLTAEEAAGLPSKWTAEELDGLEKTLREHETWLNEWVEKQKSVKMNEDPVISTTEMKARAKTLEMHLQKLVKRKIPKVKKTTSSSTLVATTSSSESETPDSSPTAVVEPESEGQPTETHSPPVKTGRPDDEL